MALEPLGLRLSNPLLDLLNLHLSPSLVVVVVLIHEILVLSEVNFLPEAVRVLHDLLEITLQATVLSQADRILLLLFCISKLLLSAFHGLDRLGDLSLLHLSQIVLFPPLLLFELSLSLL